MNSYDLVFPFSPRQREAFTADDSSLISRWATEYDFLFDEMDLSTARNQAPIRKGGYHFYEWLAAILIYQATGMLSLVEGYQGMKHTRKQSVLRELLTDEQRNLILNTDKAFKAQAPDLLVYAPDYSSFFFCEVKGPRDKLRPNAESFCRAIESACGKPIVIARFVDCRTILSVPK